MIALALLLAAQVATSTATPCVAPVDAMPADLAELWCGARTDATRWERLAGRRAIDLGTCRAGLADRDRALAACHARLVEAPPPAAEPTSPFLRVLGASAGAAIGAGGAALACAEGRCSALGSVGATTAAGALGALVGGLVTEWLSP